jgi:hypothetical protein
MISLSLTAVRVTVPIVGSSNQPPPPSTSSSKSDEATTSGTADSSTGSAVGDRVLLVSYSLSIATGGGDGGWGLKGSLEDGE